MSVAPSGTLVAARYQNGAVVKGHTADFLPSRAYFHVVVDGKPKPVRIHVRDLKALFFIKTKDGDPHHEEDKSLEHLARDRMKVWVQFECDNEELAGWTMSSLSGKTGLFMIPMDQNSNIEKLFVFRAALSKELKGADAEAAALDYAERNTVGPSGDPVESPWTRKERIADMIKKLLDE